MKYFQKLVIGPSKLVTVSHAKQVTKCLCVRKFSAWKPAWLVVVLELGNRDFQFGIKE